MTASATVLDDPSAVFRPLTLSEAELLRGFVVNVRQLGQMRFLKEVPQSATMRFDHGAFESKMEEPDEEALRAAITVFRHIYSHTEAHSFKKSMNLLKRNAHEHAGTERDEAIALLDGHLESEREAIQSGVGMGIVFERPEGADNITTERIIDAYFHGYYLHSGTEKSKLVKELEDLEPWPKYTMYTVMLALHNVYWRAANAVDLVLADPDLLDADAT